MGERFFDAMAAAMPAGYRRNQCYAFHDGFHAASIGVSVNEAPTTPEWRREAWVAGHAACRDWLQEHRVRACDRVATPAPASSSATTAPPEATMTRTDEAERAWAVGKTALAVLRRDLTRVAAGTVPPRVVDAGDYCRPQYRLYVESAEALAAKLTPYATKVQQ